MIDYISSSPEAIVTLVVSIVGLLISTGVLLYSIFADYPVIIQQLQHRGLVFVGSDLKDKVKVTFEHMNQIREIHDLHQVDFEILNSDPKQKVIDKTITIHWKSDKVEILGVTAANINNQTPELGGRKITTRIEQVPIDPPDILLGTVSQSFYPALVLHIPYLDKVTQNDRVFLQITYDGPYLLPHIQGAKFRLSSRYHDEQRKIIRRFGYALVSYSMTFWFAAMRLEGIPLFQYNLYTNPLYLMGVGYMLASVCLLFMLVIGERWWRKWMRTLPNPLIPPPYESEALTKLYFHDTMN